MNENIDLTKILKGTEKRLSISREHPSTRIHQGQTC